MTIFRIFYVLAMLYFAFSYAYEDVADSKPHQPKWLTRWMVVGCVISAVAWVW